MGGFKGQIELQVDIDVGETRRVFGALNVAAIQ